MNYFLKTNTDWVPNYSFKKGMKECPACGLKVKRGLHIHMKYCDEINNI